MSVKLLTELHLEFLSLKGGCTGSSDSTHVKIPHCWKSHVMAQLWFQGCLTTIRIDVNKGNKKHITKKCKNPTAGRNLVKYKETPGKLFCNHFCEKDLCNTDGDCDPTADGKCKNMGCNARKPVFWVFDQARLRITCSATESS